LRHLQWRQVDLLEGYLTVGKSKTEAGSGSGIPLSATALACLKEWRSQFPDCQPSHFVFPTEGYAAKSDEAAGETTVGRAVYGTDPTKPILSWKSGWTVARKTAQVSCRWHDLRHCFVSALSERKASDATIKALSGHISNKMWSAIRILGMKPNGRRSQSSMIQAAWTTPRFHNILRRPNLTGSVGCCF
jgi:integrase